MKKFATLAMFVGVILVGISPALAHGSDNNGGSAVVSATVTVDGVHVQSTKGLSRVTVVLCDGDTVVFDSWDGEQLVADLPVVGGVEAVFIHSGDNTTEAAQTLLAQLAGDDAVKGNSTGATAYYNADNCQAEPTTTTTQPPVVTTTTEPPVVTTTTQPPVVTTTTTAPPVVTTTTEPPVVTTTTEPSVVTTTTQPSTDVEPVVVTHADPTPGTDVLGVRFDQPAPVAELPRTGSASAVLASFGALIGLTGLGLLLLSALLKRRVQSN